MRLYSQLFTVYARKRRSSYQVQQKLPNNAAREGCPIWRIMGSYMGKNRLKRLHSALGCLSPNDFEEFTDCPTAQRGALSDSFDPTCPIIRVQSMIVAIHQPNFLPWLGFFYKMLKADIFVFLDNVQFSKNSYQNRVKIKSSQGAIWLTVPNLHNFGQLTKDMRMNNKEPWREKHLKTFEMNYKKAPYFNTFYPLISEIYYKKDWELLSEFNIELIKIICNFLGIKTKTIKASDLDVSGSSTGLLVSIVKKLGGSVYLSGYGGMKYQDEEKFKENGIELIYTDFKHPVYPQLWGDFIEGLSIIDLIFNCGKESLKYLVK